MENGFPYQTTVVGELSPDIFLKEVSKIQWCSGNIAKIKKIKNKIIYNYINEYKKKNFLLKRILFLYKKNVSSEIEENHTNEHFLDGFSVDKELTYTNYFYIDSSQEYKKKKRTVICDSITEYENKIKVYEFSEKNPVDNTKSKLTSFKMIVPFIKQQIDILGEVSRYEVKYDVVCEEEEVKHYGDINNFGTYGSGWYKKTNNSSVSDESESSYVEFMQV